MATLIRLCAWGLCSLCLLSATGPATADLPSPDRVELARKALQTGDRATVRGIADAYDGWPVARRLAASNRELALAFAAASDAPDAVRLAAYLQKLDSRPRSEALLAALRRCEPLPEEKARRAFTEEIRRVLPDADPLDQVTLHRALGRMAGWSDPGITAFREARAAARKIGWRAGESFVLATAAMEALNGQSYEDARTLWRAQEIAERERGPAGQPQDPLHNLSALSLYQGRYSDALRAMHALLERGLPVADARPVWMNVSELHAMRGEHRSALKAARSANDLLAEDASSIERADAARLLAGRLLAVGETTEAISLLDAQLETLAADDTPRGRVAHGHCLGTLGRALWLTGELEEARTRLLTAGEVLTTNGAPVDRVRVRTHLALVAIESAEFDSALEHARSALKEAEDHDLHWDTVDAQQIVARVLHRKGRTDEAETVNEKALEAAHSLGSRSLIRDGLVRRAEILRARGGHAEALAALDEAYKVQREILFGLPEGLGARARQRHAEVLELGVATARAAQSPSQLFRWIQRARAGALLESLGNRESLRQALVPEPLRIDEATSRDAEAKAALDLREARAAGTSSRREMKALRDAEKAARKKARDVRDRIALDAELASDLLYPQATTMAAAQARLAMDEAHLSFVTHGERAAALLVTRETARIFELGSSEAIQEAAQALREASLDNEVSPTASLATLRKLLVAPLTLTAAQRRITIVPDGVLYATPLGLVFEGRTVTLAPSATTQGILAAEAAKRGTGKEVLGIGAPIYKGRGLAHLPGSKVEIGEVTKRGTALLAEAATEEKLVEALGTRKRWKAVHLACHGTLDPDQVLESSLELTASATSDGRLTAHEVFAMDIPCDLALLSACRTGEGEILRSEGLQGLPRAFMVAGAPRVICSLWKVDDASTRALMIKFYELWHPEGDTPGLPAAEALRRAQEHVRNHTVTKDGKATKPWAHPYYWAAWVLWGLST